MDFPKDTQTGLDFCWGDQYKHHKNQFCNLLQVYAQILILHILFQMSSIFIQLSFYILFQPSCKSYTS